jgi:phosphoadenosine phosphosulfate reductase
MQGKISEETISCLPQALQNGTAEEVLSWALGHLGTSNIALASSLGAEDQVLTHMLLSLDISARVFTLDTGRMHQETYSLMSKTMQKYSMRYEIVFPEREAIEKTISQHGPNFFYSSIENRQLCCGIRKVEPLKRKLAELSGWITGLRREQAVTRTALDKITWDQANSIVKVNPLADWTEAMVWDYIKKNQVPYNILHDKGFASIGCAPCTRAISKDEDVRAGRWWWENPEQKECGLHVK